MQLLSPLNKEFLQRGISQSGVYGFSCDGGSSLEKVCNSITGCKVELSSLKAASISDLRSSLAKTDGTLSFGPTYNDGIFFPKDIRKNVESNSLNCYDFIFGWNSRDGNLLPLMGGTDLTTAKKLGNWLRSMSGSGFMYQGFEYNNELQIERIFTHYTSQNRDMVDMVTDIMFMMPLLDLADVFVKAGCQNTFAYRFSHEVPNPFFGGTGAGHGDDLRYLFAYGLSMSPKEKNVSNTLLSYWSQFAKNGSPPPNWPKYSQNRYIYDINNKPKIWTDNTALNFWRQDIFPTSSRRHLRLISDVISDAISDVISDQVELDNPDVISDNLLNIRIAFHVDFGNVELLWMNLCHAIQSF
eukprot:TRINITY_DN1234_c0_g1_i5.p1 TRINITY_DN1234_c0_g1~~TRINITY_DN1234_c0_g1_i5.p1  ORF type:complete len:355 (+),score=50.92 TRINITY_DN1234_c0_g1_i5:302-1366(+)